MPTILTTGSTLACPHGGSVQLSAGRTQLTVAGKPVLAKADVMGKPISGCSTVTSPQAGTKQCLTVTSVVAGEAQHLSAGGMPVLTTQAKGLTDGVAGGPVQWSVQSAGHTLLEGS